MPVTTFSSREFNQDTGRAKKAAANGPVFITDRGKPAHVLLSIKEYRRIYDALIAATALIHGMTIVTHNITDFAPTGAKFLNPWVSGP